MSSFFDRAARAALSIAAVITLAAAAGAQTITFETPTYTVGDINGQDGWIKTGPYDAAVAATAFPGFGAQALRISNGVTSGSFGDMTFSRPVPNEAGEASATNGGFSGGIRQSYFSAQFSLGTTSPGAVQPGLVISISPDRGDGARMSYIRLEDQGNGVHVLFDDFRDVAPFGTFNGDDANGCNAAGGDDFYETDIATLDRSVAHQIRFVMFFVNGPRNDVVQIYIDGALVHIGTSWEDYFRYCAEQSADNTTHTVDSLIMRTGGTAVPANLGNGFLFDNMTLTTSTSFVVDDDGAGTSADCDDPTPTYSSIQDAHDAAPASSVVKVCPGTYSENVTITKSLVLNGAQAGVDARGRSAPESIVSPANAANPTINVAFNGTVVINGFSFAGGPAGSSGVIFTSVGPNAGMVISNNRFSNYPAAAVWMNRGGDNITIDRNVMDGSNIAGGGQAIFANGPQNFNGLWITDNNIINNPGRYGFFIDGNHNMAESSTRDFLIGGNLFDNNLQGMNLGSRSAGTLGAPATGAFAGAITGNIFSNSSANGIQAGIQHVLVNGNTFSGNALSGLVLTSFGNTGADRGAQNSSIVSNTFVGNGFGGANQAGIFFSGTQGVGLIETNTASFNRIVGNAVGIQYGSSVAAGNNATINVENNWWGCNYGPGTGGAGCSGTPNAAVVFAGNGGSLDADPWLTLTSSASPNVLGLNETAAVTSKLTINSAAVDTSGLGTVPDGIGAAFSGVFGTVNPSSGSTVSGVTGTTFTATGYGLGGVNTTVDSQTTNAPINVNVACRSLSIPNETSLQSGALHTIAVNTDDLTNRNVLSADFTVTYNTAVINNPAVSLTGLTAGSELTVNDLTPGTLVISVFRTTPFSGSGAFVNLTFNVIGVPGTVSPLNFTSFRYNEGTPCSATTNGSITVIGGTISGTVTYGNALVGPTPLDPRFVPNVTVTGTGSPTVSTTTNGSGAYALSGFGPGSYTRSASKVGGFDVNAITSFDASRVARHVAGIEPFTGVNQPVVADVSGTGGVTSFDAALIARYVAGLPGGGSSGNWIFAPTAYGPSTVYANITGEDYVALLMGEVSGNWDSPASHRISIDARNAAKLALPHLVVSAASQVTIPVSITNVANRGVTAYQFDVLYNASVLRPAVNSVTLEDTISRGYLATVNPDEPGRLRVVVFGTLPIDADGTLLDLHFNAIGRPGSSSAITFDQLMLNEGDPAVIFENGAVRIGPAIKTGETLTGRVLTSTGDVVAGAEVTAADVEGTRYVAVSDDQGIFRFGGLTVGQSYTVMARADGLQFMAVGVTMTGRVGNIDVIASP